MSSLSSLLLVFLGYLKKKRSVVLSLTCWLKWSQLTIVVFCQVAHILAGSDHGVLKRLILCPITVSCEENHVHSTRHWDLLFIYQFKKMCYARNFSVLAIGEKTVIGSISQIFLLLNFLICFQWSAAAFHCGDMWSYSFYGASEKFLWRCDSGCCLFWWYVVHHMVLSGREEALHWLAEQLVAQQAMRLNDLWGWTERHVICLMGQGYGVYVCVWGGGGGVALLCNQGLSITKCLILLNSIMFGLLFSSVIRKINFRHVKRSILQMLFSH